MTAWLAVTLSITTLIGAVTLSIRAWLRERDRRRADLAAIETAERAAAERARLREIRERDRARRRDDLDEVLEETAERYEERREQRPSEFLRDLERRQRERGDS